MKNYIIIISVILTILVFASWKSSTKEKTTKTTNTIFITDTIVITDTIEITKIVEDTAVFTTPTKMNVLYIGIDNPLEIDVFGDAKNISVSISKGNIEKKGSGKYVVRVKRVEETTVSVYSDGILLGTRKFDCKVVPDPTAIVAGKTGGSIAKDTLTYQKYVKATLDNFPYDINFPVTGFLIPYHAFSDSPPTTGAEIEPHSKSYLYQLKKGSNVSVEDIRARAPDGSIRLLNSIVFTIE